MSGDADQSGPSRRRYLAALGSGALAGLAGCGDSVGGDGSTPTTRAIGSPTATATGRPTATSADGDTPTDAEPPTDGAPEDFETPEPPPRPDSTWDEGGPPDREDWTVTLQDDFADGAVDWDLWEIGYGPASEAPCAGIECARRENVAVEDGRLVLTTTPEGADEIPNDVWLAEYTTGAVSTASTFHQQFGYFEAKAKIPIQPGALPAFWAWSADGNPPEIDFYEVFGESTELSFGMPVDCNDNGEFIGTGTSYEPGDRVDSTFHVIGTAWTPEYVAWYVDGQEIHREDGFYVEECHTPEPMYPMLNTYVIDEESWAGDEVVGNHAEADYPYTHEFEWVRVWQRDDQL